MSVLPPSRQLLKNATRDLVRAGGGGEACAGMTRVAQQKLSDYGNHNHPSFMPADVVADLESVTVGLPGHPIVTRALAHAAGFALVALAAAPPTARSWLEHITCVAKEAGEAVAKLAEAAGAARPLTPRDRAEALREIDEAVAALVAARDAFGRDGNQG